MPVRSLNSSVLRWPDKETVVRALRSWIQEQKKKKPGLLGFGFFGSYARGDWGPGSDLDLLAVVEEENAPFIERARRWPLERLPVPASILVYTLAEWNRLQAEGGRFARTLAEETVWLIGPAPTSGVRDARGTA